MAGAIGNYGPRPRLRPHQPPDLQVGSVNMSDQLSSFTPRGFGGGRGRPRRRNVEHRLVFQRQAHGLHQQRHQLGRPAGPPPPPRSSSRSTPASRPRRSSRSSRIAPTGITTATSNRSYARLDVKRRPRPGISALGKPRPFVLIILFLVILLFLLFLIVFCEEHAAVDRRTA